MKSDLIKYIIPFLKKYIVMWIFKVDRWNVGTRHHGRIGRTGSARSIGSPSNDPLQPDNVDDDLHRSGIVKFDE
jgi:hypothetical protein